jgi:GNAT superfamily N-acetyltransferase
MVNDLDFDRLDGPSPAEFDCGRDDQNLFLRERAWLDQQALLSTTYLLKDGWKLAAFATLCMSGVSLHRYERGPAIRYQDVGALKLAQLGVDRAFQGRGLGGDVVAFVIELARSSSKSFGCRYVVLDAQPELEPWYVELGFVRNHLQQERRVMDAISHRRDPETIAVSMRYDLRRAS